MPRTPIHCLFNNNSIFVVDIFAGDNWSKTIQVRMKRILDDDGTVSLEKLLGIISSSVFGEGGESLSVEGRGMTAALSSPADLKDYLGHHPIRLLAHIRSKLTFTKATTQHDRRVQDKEMVSDLDGKPNHDPSNDNRPNKKQKISTPTSKLDLNEAKDASVDTTNMTLSTETKVLKAIGKAINFSASDPNCTRCVAISSDGKIMAVGSPNIGVNGRVQVYHLVEGGEWHPMGESIDLCGLFGYCVALSGVGLTLGTTRIKESTAAMYVHSDTFTVSDGKSEMQSQEKQQAIDAVFLYPCRKMAVVWSHGRPRLESRSRLDTYSQTTSDEDSRSSFPHVSLC